MKVYGCVIGFCEEPFIAKCLESIRHHVDVLVYVDGAYKFFPHKVPWSTDKTCLIADSIADIIITTKIPWEDEIQKRNAYLLAKPGDWYFVIDCDEIFTGDLKSLHLSTTPPLAFMVDIQRGNLPLMCILRCFQASEGLHYYGAHNAVFAKDKLLNGLNNPLLKGCKLMHYCDSRESQRVAEKRSYYHKLQSSETDFRITHRI